MGVPTAKELVAAVRAVNGKKQYLNVRLSRVCNQSETFSVFIMVRTCLDWISSCSGW
jgi:hypothetical protein